MSELDEIWSSMLGDAAAKAGLAGRHDVAEYLRLKAANDSIRSGGSRWLLDTLVDLAKPEMANLPALKIERESPHNFEHKRSNMVGSLVRVSNGLRCFTAEAGWVRTPSDGIMQGGALAVARLRHFGLARHDADLRLVRVSGVPQWLDESDSPVDVEFLARHLAVCLE